MILKFKLTKVPFNLNLNNVFNSILKHSSLDIIMRNSTRNSNERFMLSIENLKFYFKNEVYECYIIYIGI